MSALTEAVRRQHEWAEINGADYEAIVKWLEANDVPLEEWREWREAASRAILDGFEGDTFKSMGELAIALLGMGLMIGFHTGVLTAVLREENGGD